MSGPSPVRSSARWLARRGRRATRTLRSLGVRSGLVAYRPERRTADAWTRAYRSGDLDFYGDLGEIARYGAVTAYVSWWVERAGRAARVLDIGCGTGLLLRRLPVQDLAAYRGVDLSPAAIDEARCITAGVDADFEVGDASEIELGSADVVVLNEMLYYVEDLDPLLHRIEEAARDGIVIVSMWRHPGDKVLWAELDRRWTLVDRVEVRNPSNRVNRRGWLVACYRPSRSAIIAP